MGKAREFYETGAIIRDLGRVLTEMSPGPIIHFDSLL
jgi:hypothetical protein